MLQNCSIIKVANVFFDEPTKVHYLTEVSKKSKLAHTSTKKYLQDLKKENIIRENITIMGERKFPIFRAKINSEDYKFFKKSFNIIRLKQSGLIDFLRESFMPNSIVLFGSYANGEDIEGSDVDIFLECNKKDINLMKFRNKIKRRVQLHFKDDFKKYPKELKNNIINGVVLEGYLEAFEK